MSRAVSRTNDLSSKEEFENFRTHLRRWAVGTGYGHSLQQGSSIEPFSQNDRALLKQYIAWRNTRSSDKLPDSNYPSKSLLKVLELDVASLEQSRARTRTQASLPKTPEQPLKLTPPPQAQTEKTPAQSSPAQSSPEQNSVEELSLGVQSTNVLGLKSLLSTWARQQGIFVSSLPNTNEYDAETASLVSQFKRWRKSGDISGERMSRSEVGALLEAVNKGRASEKEQISRTTPHSQHSTELSPEFLDAFDAMCSRMNIKPSHMLAVMLFESGLDPSERNSMSGATGLIQIHPRYAQEILGRDFPGKKGNEICEQLARMTRLEQLPHVEKYLKHHLRGHPVNSLEDLYMGVLFPRAVPHGNDYILFSSGTKVYNQNQGLDVNDDGIVTKGEATRLVRDYLPEALSIAKKS